MNATTSLSHMEVTCDMPGLTSRAGTALLSGLADALGLTDALVSGLALHSRTGLPEMEGTRSAQKVVASRGKGRLSREESCYYSEPEGAGVLRGHRRYLEVAEGRRLGELQGGEDLALAGRGQ